MAKHIGTGIVAEATAWRDAILVCRKCSKKLGGGFGPEGDQGLARALKTGLRAAGRRGSSRVIETKCLGLCPKNAVTVLSSSATGTALIVPAGTEVSALLARLPPTP